jgi:hypothetical protein
MSTPVGLPPAPAPEFADDDSLPPVRLPSTWRREAAVEVGTTQTLPVSFAEGGTQTNLKTTSEVSGQGRNGHHHSLPYTVCLPRPAPNV